MTKSDGERLPTPGPEVRPMESNERNVWANEVDLCVQTFGDRADPAILLIHGAAASVPWWEDGFCERLAAGSWLLALERPGHELPPADWGVVVPAILQHTSGGWSG